MTGIDKSELRTRYANQTVDLASAFAEKLSALRLGGRYRPEIMANDQLSTADGAQAAQAIRLVPDDGSAPIIIGSANVKSMTAELRTHSYVDQAYRGRFGKPFDVYIDEYDKFATFARKLFESRDMTVTMTLPPSLPPPPMEEPDAPSPGLSKRLALIMVASVVAVVALVVGLTIVMH